MAWLASITSWLQTKSAVNEAAECYAAIVQQARQPVFYEAGQVSDTPQGRFEMVMLHTFLIMRRLHNNLEFNQTLFDLMFADFDINLRELGVGDLGVGKRVKNWAQAYKGRAISYDNGLAGTDDLAAALRRNIYADQSSQEDRLAAYMRETVAILATQTDSNIMDGQISWSAFSEIKHD